MEKQLSKSFLSSPINNFDSDPSNNTNRSKPMKNRCNMSKNAKIIQNYLDAAAITKTATVKKTKSIRMDEKSISIKHSLAAPMSDSHAMNYPNNFNDIVYQPYCISQSNRNSYHHDQLHHRHQYGIPNEYIPPITTQCKTTC